MPRHINSLRLLGVSDGQMTKLTGQSVATVKRSWASLCKNWSLEGAKPTLEVLQKAKHRVKGTEFTAQDSLDKVEAALDRTLSTDSRKYLVLIWFGNVHKHPCDYGQVHDTGLEHRFINPKSARWGPTGALRQAKRLQNLPLALSLMGLPQDEVNEFCKQIADQVLPQLEEDGQNQAPQLRFPLQQDNRFDLLRITPRAPFKRKQKEKKLLIKFARKHLERCEGNFIYAERFKRTNIIPDGVNLKDVDENLRLTWWVFGPRDILNWLECYVELMKEEEREREKNKDKKKSKRE